MALRAKCFCATKYFIGFLVCFLLLQVYLTTICYGFQHRNTAGLPFCTQQILSEFPSPTVVVSTLNGCLTAFDATSGLVLWNHTTGPGILLSSTINNYKFFSNGQSVQMIPSLNGDLYSFDGEEMGYTPISADSLLSSSIKLSDDTLIVGGKEIKLYGISKTTGQLYYSCGVEPCKYYSSSINNDDILVVRHTTRTIRALSSVTGIEKWNYSVGQHEINIVSSGGCHRNNFGYGSHSEDDEPTVTVDEDPSVQLDIKFDPADGYVTTTSSIGEQYNTWTYKFDVPIVNAWRIHNHVVHSLNIFEHNKYSNRDDEDGSNSDSPVIYLGNYNKQLFILQSHNGIKSLDSTTFNKNQHVTHPQVGWQPYLNTALSRTPIIHLKPPNAASEIMSVQSNIKNTAVVLGADTEDYPFDTGLYLVVSHPINTSNASLEFEELESLDQILIVSLWYWWKEVLAISITFAVVVNICITRHHVRHIRDRLLKENSKTIVSTPHISDSTQQTKESKSSESLSSYGTPTGDFVSRYFTDFEPLQTLGKGGFGVVFEARNKIDDCHYAVKRIRMPNKGDSKEKIMREVKALAKLDHAGIVRYYNSWLECPPLDWHEEMDHLLHVKDVGTPASALTTDDLHTSFLESSKCVIEDSYSSDKQTVSHGLNNNFTYINKDIQDESLLNSSLELTSDYLKSDANNTTNMSRKRQLKVIIPLPKAILKSGSSDSFIQFDEDAPEANETQKSNSLLHKHDVLNSNKTSLLQDKSPKSYLYIQMQLCRKESLKDWLKYPAEDRNKFEILDFFYQIVCAVEYVHQQGLIHRDLKPSNIFFALDGSVKIGDFGLVAAMTANDEEGYGDQYLEAQNQRNQRHTNNVGTTLYMSPEQLSFKNYDHKVDIYSLGLILFELLVPFNTEMERIKVMGEARGTKFPAWFIQKYNEECDLVQKMLSHNSKDRPNASEIKHHSILQDFQPRPEFLRHQRSRSMSRTYSTSSSSSNNSSGNILNGDNV